MPQYDPNVSIPVNGPVGRTLLVDSGASPAGGFGTISEALTVARPGDTIFVQPGTYDENITVSTDYITIVGAQVGRYGWPDIAPTTGVALTVTGQGFTAKRLRLVSDDSDVVIQRGNGFKYEDCVFDSGTGLAATEGLLRLEGDEDDDGKTASEGLVKGCLLRGASGVGIIFQAADPPGNGVGSSDCEIRDCKFQSSLDGTAGIDLVTQDADTGPSLYSVKNLLVVGCHFCDKNKTAYIDFTTANAGAAADQTGTVQDCYFATDAITTTNIAIVGTGVTVVGCYDTVGVQDGSGLD